MKSRLLKYAAFALAAALMSMLALILIFKKGVPEPSHSGRSLHEWLADLESTDPAVKADATAAVRTIGTNAIPYLVNEFTVDPDRVQSRLLRLLQKQNIVKVTVLSPDQRMNRAVRGFEALGEAATPAIPLLKPVLPDSPGYAPIALTYIGTNALPALFEALGSSNIYVVHNTCAGMANMVHRQQIKPTDLKPAVPMAIQMLQSKNENSRWRASSLLAAIGPAAREAILPLEETLALETNPTVRETAARALSKIDPTHPSQPALDVFRQQLSHPKEHVRIMGAIGVVQLSPKITATVPLLVQCLNDSSHVVRFNAAGALGLHRENPELIVPLLMKCMNDSNALVRLTAATALGNQGAAASKAIPLLQHTATNDTKEVQGNARHAVQMIMHELKTGKKITP